MNDGADTNPRFGADRQDAIGASASIGVVASTAALSALRHRVVQFAREAGGDDSVVQSLELAVSELATNVIEHTSATEIRVSVRHTPTRWILDVAGADELDLPAEIPMPPADPAASRGLFVTRSVMDTIDTVAVDGQRVVRCTMFAR
jgi:serine/threonine-protein kinase RsbW